MFFLHLVNYLYEQSISIKGLLVGIILNFMTFFSRATIVRDDVLFYFALVNGILAAIVYGFTIYDKVKSRWTNYKGKKKSKL